MKCKPLSITVFYTLLCFCCFYLIGLIVLLNYITNTMLNNTVTVWQESKRKITVCDGSTLKKSLRLVLRFQAIKILTIKKWQLTQLKPDTVNTVLFFNKNLYELSTEFLWNKFMKMYLSVVCYIFNSSIIMILQNSKF